MNRVMNVPAQLPANCNHPSDAAYSRPVGRRPPRPTWPPAFDGTLSAAAQLARKPQWRPMQWHVPRPETR